MAPDGSFTLPNVTPGEYKVSVSSGEDANAEGAVATIVFGGEDIAGLNLVTSPAGRIRGRVVSDSGEAIPTEPRMRVTARATSGGMRPFMRAASSENGRVQDDMTFEVLGVFGPTTLGVSPLPAGWAVKSIDYDGADLANKPLDVQGGQLVTGVTVMLSKGLPDLQGTLLDAAGAPSAGHSPALSRRSRQVDRGVAADASRASRRDRTLCLQQDSAGQLLRRCARLRADRRLERSRLPRGTPPAGKARECRGRHLSLRSALTLRKQ